MWVCVTVCVYVGLRDSVCVYVLVNVGLRDSVCVYVGECGFV